MTIVLHSLWIKSKKDSNIKAHKIYKRASFDRFLILNIKLPDIHITLDTVSLAGVARQLPQDTAIITHHADIDHTQFHLWPPLVVGRVCGASRLFDKKSDKRDQHGTRTKTPMVKVAQI